MQAVPIMAEPAPRRSRWPARIGLLLFGAFLGITALVVVSWESHSPGQAFVQPDSVTYDDDRGHRVGIVTEHQWFPGDEYLLYAGSDPGMSYGHFVELGEGPLGGEGPPRITAAKWTKQGVDVTLATGHRVFIPADLFTGGR